MEPTVNLDDLYNQHFGEATSAPQVTTQPNLDSLYQQHFGDSGVAIPQNPTTFLGEMGANASNAIQSGKDLLSGNYEDFDNVKPTPKTEALAGKLFPEGSSGSFMDAVHNLGNTSPSDWSSSLLEKLGESPEGKALSVIGGLNPVYNAASTAINRYVNPAIQNATGIAPENLQLGELAAAPLGLEKAAGINDPVISAAKSVGTNALENLATPEPGEINAATIRNIAGKTFDAADAAGGALPVEDTNSWVNNTQKILPQSDKVKAILGSSPATDLISRLSAAKDSPLTFSDAQSLDSGLGELAQSQLDSKTGKYSPDGKKYLQVQSSLRDTIANAPPADGSDLINQGRQLWATQAKYGDIERLINNAAISKNPTSTLQGSLISLLKNPSRTRGLSPEELSAIQDASKTGSGTGLLKFFGGKIVSGATGALAGSVGGVPGSLIGAGLAEAAAVPLRSIVKNIQFGKANNILDTLAQRPEIQGIANQIPAQAPTFLNKTAQFLLDKLKSGGNISVADIGGLPVSDAQTLLNQIKMLPAPDKEAFGTPSAEKLGENNTNNIPVPAQGYVPPALPAPDAATIGSLTPEQIANMQEILKAQKYPSSKIILKK